MSGEEWRVCPAGRDPPGEWTTWGELARLELSGHLEEKGSAPSVYLGEAMLVDCPAPW